MKKIILASSSPRRKEICEKYGLNPEIIKPDIDEVEREDETPYQTVMALSFEKANHIAEQIEDKRIIIASDTIVYFQNEILGKPKEEEDALNILTKLSGKEHSVITGIAIIESNTNNKLIDYVETRVKFKNLSEDKIKRYIKTGEYLDKAGGYGIQGLGQLLIDEIKGSYLNVVGFPIERISDLLEEYFDFKIL